MAATIMTSWEGSVTAKKERPRTPWPLWIWVALGTVVTTGVGTALLLIFARLQAGEWIGTDGFYLDGNQWFDAARTTVTLVGIIGLGGAAFLAYRKQLSTEASHLLERSSHRLEEASALRNRYTTCAEQLGHGNPAIRLAGVYALASLADDWHTFGNPGERQVCIDLLCAYLRSDRASPTNQSTASAPRPTAGPRLAGRRSLRLAPKPPQRPKVDRQEMDVRSAIVSVIRDHTQRSGGAAKSWSGCRFDFASANLTRANLAGANLADANLTHAFLHGASLVGAGLVGANLTYADMTAVDLTDADLLLADLTNANLTRANLTRADLTAVDLTDANLDEIFYSSPPENWPDSSLPPSCDPQKET